MVNKLGRHEYLHGDKTIIDHDFLGEEISANSCFVLVAEFLVHILVHQGCFANTEKYCLLSMMYYSLHNKFLKDIRKSFSIQVLGSNPGGGIYSSWGN